MNDHFLVDLVEYLSLQGEDRLIARYANGLINDKCTLLAEENLFEMHASQILLIAHIVRGDEVKEGAAADSVHLRQMKSLRLQIDLWEANYAEILHKFVIGGHIGVLFEIGVRAKHRILRFEVLPDELGRVEAENHEQRAELLFALIGELRCFAGCGGVRSQS